MMPKSFEEPFRSGNFDWITNFAIKKRPIDIKTEITAKIENKNYKSCKKKWEHKKKGR